MVMIIIQYRNIVKSKKFQKSVVRDCLMHHETVAVLIGIKQMKHTMNMIVKKS